MRYVLRNQEKIKNELGKDVLDRINNSLKSGFNRLTESDIIRCDGDKYDVVVINDIGHSVNVIVFYIISNLYDVYTIAFKEFIG